MPEVTLPVIETLLSPPLRLLARRPASGALIGRGRLPNWQGGASFGAWGLSFTVADIPVGLGYTETLFHEYELPLFQIAVWYRDIEGLPHIQEQYSSRVEFGTWRFENGLAYAVDYWVLPFCSVSWSYLELPPN